MRRANSDNLFGISPYIVDLSAAEGSYTTIQSAIDAALAAGGGMVCTTANLGWQVFIMCRKYNNHIEVF